MDGNTGGAAFLEGPAGPLNADCPGREIFKHVTGQWALLILIALGPGPLRFHELRDRVGGISEKMLSQTLKTLARDGLVSRHVEATIPPRVSYELTGMGRELSDVFGQLLGWIGRRIEDILQAQERYDGND